MESVHKKFERNEKGCDCESRPLSEIDMHRQIFYLFEVLSLCIFNTKSICGEKKFYKMYISILTIVHKSSERKNK